MSAPQSTPPNDLGEPRPLWSRVAGGVRRRALHAWRTLRGERTQAEAIEAAWEWLQAVDETDLHGALYSTTRSYAQLEPLAARIAELIRQQRSNGAVAGETLADSKQATRELLALCRQQVAMTFHALVDLLPQRINPYDGRMRAVNEWLAEWVTDDAQVADIGCGSGRFLAHLASHDPQRNWLAVDPSPAMLSQVAPEVPRVAGSLLSLPLADGTCDGVFCIEALEHSLLPREAVRELCRVTRSGGRILIIDKHTRFQPLSEHMPWERWFDPDEVCRWLARDCREIVAREIPHGASSMPTGLFLCWTAVRK